MAILTTNYKLAKKANFYILINNKYIFVSSNFKTTNIKNKTLLFIRTIFGKWQINFNN